MCHGDPCAGSGTPDGGGGGPQAWAPKTSHSST